MRSRLWLVGAGLGVIAALAAGCGSKSPTSPTFGSNDQTEVAATLASAPTLVDDSLAESSNHVAASALRAEAGGFAMASGPGGPHALTAAIVPYQWWQVITRLSRTWTFAFSDTDSTGRPATCIATLHKHMLGSLVIVPVSDTLTRVTKPLDKTLVRMAMLKRLLIGGVRSWRIVEVTGALVTTPAPNNTTTIQSIRLQSSSGVDTTVTDPLQFFSLRHVIRFATSDSVTLTVTTTRTDDAVFIHRWDWRHRLHNNLDGTYTISWVTSPWSGWRHFGIQALSHASLYDDTAPVDQEAWHLPFRVAQADVNYYP